MCDDGSEQTFQNGAPCAAHSAQPLPRGQAAALGTQRKANDGSPYLWGQHRAAAHASHCTCLHALPLPAAAQFGALPTGLHAEHEATEDRHAPGRGVPDNSRSWTNAFKGALSDLSACAKLRFQVLAGFDGFDAIYKRCQAAQGSDGPSLWPAILERMHGGNDGNMIVYLGRPSKPLTPMSVPPLLVPDPDCRRFQTYAAPDPAGAHAVWSCFCSPQRRRRPPEVLRTPAAALQPCVVVLGTVDADRCSAALAYARSKVHIVQLVDT